MHATVSISPEGLSPNETLCVRHLVFEKSLCRATGIDQCAHLFNISDECNFLLNLRRTTDMLLSRSGPLSFRPNLIPHMTHIFCTAAGHNPQRGGLRLCDVKYNVLDLCSFFNCVSVRFLATPHHTMSCICYLIYACRIHRFVTLAPFRQLVRACICEILTYD